MSKRRSEYGHVCADAVAPHFNIGLAFKPHHSLFMASTLSAEELLRSATQGFDHLFANDIDAAQKAFESQDAPFHLLGLGVVAFLQAALGMEVG